MKTNFTAFLSFFLSIGSLSAQPFSLFTEGSSKDFAPLDETWERNYSLKIDSVYAGGVVAEYFLHTVINDNVPADFQPEEGDPVQCFGWGDCYENSGSAGFGTKVYSPQPHHYHFMNSGGDSLRFDFSADSSVFYETDEEIYALIFEGESEQTVFGTTEQVQSYRIRHYDAEGNEITSALHDFVIRIGENVGLIDFLWVDEFPLTEMPLTLIGDAELDQSLHVLTGEMIYDFEAGDTIQYKITDIYSNPNIPVGPTVEVKYRKRIILNRAEEADSLRYTVLYQSFIQNGVNMSEWTEEEVYYRHDTLSILPFYKTRGTIDPYEQSNQEHLFSQNFCDGVIRLGYKGVSGPHHYCGDYNAWCSYDTNGPPEITRFEYVAGLGRFFHRSARNGFESLPSWSYTTEVVYFSKGGVGCGEEAVLSAENTDRPAPKFTVFPNPTRGMINLRISSEVHTQPSTVDVVDLSGRRAAAYPWRGGNASFDVSNLASGLYLIQVIGGEGVIGTERLVVE